MLILPVLDLQAGRVVRGIRGERSLYRPLTSPLVPDANPITAARAVRERFGLTTLYIADLDAIAGQEPSLRLFEQLSSFGFQLWVDAGLREGTLPGKLFAAGVAAVIAGLETLPGPELLRSLLPIKARILISLDLKGGRALTSYARWLSSPPADIAQEIIALGYTRLLILDLARVGTREGTGTEELCARILAQARERGAEVQLFAGGGVRSKSDLDDLHQAGLAGVLVASALHDGMLDDCLRFGCGDTFSTSLS
jgi:phosphoribosylformimino-5-aminoimidazole carboxamide ribotide isomerase